MSHAIELDFKGIGPRTPVELARAVTLLLGRRSRMERLSDEELVALLADTDSDRAERMQAVTDGEQIAQAICAFANDMPNHQRPGVLFVNMPVSFLANGLSMATDRRETAMNAKDDGTCANNPVDDQTLLTLSDMRSTAISSPSRR